MKKVLLTTLALAAVIFTACEEDTLQNTVIDYTAPVLEVSAETVNVGSDAGATGTFTITTDQTVINAEVDFSCKSWLSVAVSGNTATVTVKVTNPGDTERTGKVHVIVGEKGVTAEKWISIVQAPNEKCPHLFSIPPPTFSLPERTPGKAKPSRSIPTSLRPPPPSAPVQTA